MARGSSSGGTQSPKRKNSKSSKTKRNQPTLNGSDANHSTNMTNTNTENTKPVQLAPPSTQEQWTLKNPIPLVLEILIIVQMFFVTLFFKTFKVFLPKSKKSVKGHVVLITGSGRGLGRELALSFAHLGAKVACVDVDETSNEETVKLIESKVPGALAKAYTVNVAVSSETAALAVKVELDLGPVDVLINNAAVIVGHTFLGAQDHTISSIININLLGFWMIRSFLPSMMKRNSGHIVAISSISSLSGEAKLSAYSASKWGVNGMMESLREELREHSHNKIHTTVVIPRLINTSADYMKSINSRLPVLSVECAAKATVDGILTNEVEFTIPHITYFTNILRKLFPVNISDSIKNVFYVKILLPPQEDQDNLPNMSIINRTVAAN